MFLHPLAFFISLAIGLFFVYISTTTPDIIILYPTPLTKDKYIYQDVGEVCYKYEMEKQNTCPKKKEEISELPIQEFNINEKQKESIFSEWKKKLNEMKN